MQNLIDETYFWGDLELGNLFNSTSGRLLGEAGSNAYTELYKYIAKYQKVYLTQMFGEDIANEEALPDELKSLIIDDDLKTSPLANYVYYFIKRGKHTYTTAMGEKKLNAPNTLITVDQKPFMAFFECVKESVRIQNEMYETETLGDLSYINDIFPNIDFEDDIFDDTFNSYSI